jgi:amino acid permease
MKTFKAILACTAVLLHFRATASFERHDEIVDARAGGVVLLQARHAPHKTGKSTSLVTELSQNEHKAVLGNEKYLLLMVGVTLALVLVATCLASSWSEKDVAVEGVPPAYQSPTEERQQRRTSVFSPFWRSVLLIVKSTVGAGVLTLPFAFSHAGWLVGSCLTVVIAILMLGTIHVLSATVEATGAINYGDMVCMALGKNSQVFVEIAIVLYQLVLCGACLVIIGDSFSSSSSSMLHSASIWTDFRTSWRIALLIIGSTIALPLSAYYRRIARLDGLAMFGFVMVSCMVCSIIHQYLTWDGRAPSGGPVRMSGSFNGMGAAIPMIVFAFNCHPQTPRIYRELRQVDKHSSWTLVTTCAYTIIASMYVSVGVIGYMLFGNNVKSDVVSEPTLSSAFWHFLVGSQAVIAYLLNHFPLREALYDLLCMMCWMPGVRDDEMASNDQVAKSFREKDGAIPVGQSFQLAAVIFVATTAMALYIQNLKVFSPLLGFLGSVICFICPAACLWCLHPGSIWHRLGAIVFALCGTFVLGVYLLLALSG